VNNVGKLAGKPEIRNQNGESSPNDEIRNDRHSGFGFDSPFWFRVSDFSSGLLCPSGTITLPRPMKAERRHVLKANSLIWTLQGLPETIKKYQSQIALGLVLVALAIVMVRYRINMAQERLMGAQQNLGVAAEDLHRLKNMAFNPGSDGVGYMKEREEFYSDGLQQADEAFQKAPDSQDAMKAEALLDKGDLNFEMANTPEMPGAATQPSLRPAEPEDSLLSNASDAYTQVLQNYSSQKFAVTAARFGLAAVAENRAVAGGGSDASQWDAAKAQYQAVLDSDAEEAFKTIASLRLGLLPQLSKPAAIGLTATSQPGQMQVLPLGPSTQK
jgi:hypothetical protein